ncbi:MAG: DUF1236 domain-containing protein [Rhodoplanes sp.]|uniref:DUF1236 domain-containing protein n=1 Tax=Rhodoplanes sp. TaxID=1968906 RepID=UPI0017BE05A6|nr:DUF1236 domain-containing protein [Rhodoplanes sp.]NVO12593.1 DUF1236 domain-containing protein [Rhodoplanes sp.]
MMRNRILAAGLALAAFGPTFASAQNDPAGGAADMVPDRPPAEVRTYVMHERVPSVAVAELVAIGEPLPPRVPIQSVPQHDGYSFAVVNERRVIVEPRSRRVIEIYD